MLSKKKAFKENSFVIWLYDTDTITGTQIQRRQAHAMGSVKGSISKQPLSRKFVIGLLDKYTKIIGIRIPEIITLTSFFTGYYAKIYGLRFQSSN